MQIIDNQIMTIVIKLLGIVFLVLLLFGCTKKSVKPSSETETPVNNSDSTNYPGVPKSSIYEVTLIKGDKKEKLVVFQNTCPSYLPGYMNMVVNDSYPLEIFAGRSISWVNFTFSENTTIEVRVLDQSKVSLAGTVKVLPSRYGITPQVEGDKIRFTMTKPGQCSMEVGENGYKNGLMIFANPPETEIPDQKSSEFIILKNTNPTVIKSIPATYSGIYFKRGIHNIGVYNVPNHIKNIYFEEGSWVYGALIMDGNPNVKIYGRGVLSSAKLNYRESYCIEAKNQSDNIQLEGIVIADPKYFSVRLIGKNNRVDWTKIIGGWTYNCDGISVFEGSTVSNCFIWANDDNIKVYRNNITFTDCVCWQLNNGGLIQLSWGNGNATNVTISRIDVLHAEWNKDEVNRGILSCVGDKFAEGGMSGLQQNFLIEDLVTETPVSIIFRVSPNLASPNYIHGMVFKNWNVKMNMENGFNNYILGNDPNNKFDGLVFDNFMFNGTKLTSPNWLMLGKFQTGNIEAPVFK